MNSKSCIYKIYNDASDLFYIGSTSNSIIDRFNQHKSASKKKSCMSYKLFNMYNDNKIIELEEYSNIDRTELCKKETEYLARFLGDSNCLNISGKLNIGSSKNKADYMHQYTKLMVMCNICQKEIKRVGKLKHDKSSKHLTNKILYEKGIIIKNEITIKEEEEEEEEKKEEDPLLSNSQKYYQNNKDYIKERHRQYIINNKDKIKITQKKWKDELPDDKKNEMKLKSKNRAEEKLKCLSCNCIIRRGGLSRHKKAQKHLKLLKVSNIEEKFIEMSENIIITTLELLKDSNIEKKYIETLDYQN